MANSKYVKYLEIDNDFWQLQYLGRKVNEQYHVMFDQNGYYPSDDYDKYPEYDEKDIIINLRLDVVDDVIEGISYYKKVDRGLYYRGSVMKHLNAHDINVFREALDVCTISQAPAILDSLLNMPLKEGWNIKRVGGKSISFSREGKNYSLPTDYAKTMIDIARNAPDIRDNDDFWEINKKHLREKYKKALFALLFNFNKDHFPEVAFRETAKERIDREDQEETTKRELVNAINRNQKDKVYEAIENYSVIPEYAIQAAIKKRRSELLLSFLPKISSSYDLERIGEYAISAGETELLQRIAEKDSEGTNELVYKAYNEHHIDYVLFLLEKGYTLHIRPENRTSYNPEQLLPLVDCHGVYFSEKKMEQLYQSYGSEPIMKIIDNYCKSSSSLDEKGYSIEESCAFVVWLLEKKNMELIDYAAKKGIKASIDSFSKEELAIKLFNEGGELWEHGKELFSGHISYSKCLADDNLTLLKYLVKHVSVTESVLRKALQDSKNEEMQRILIQHLNLSIEEMKRPSERPLWFYALRINNLTLFEQFFEKYNKRLDDEERQKIHDYFVWYEHDVEKAKILVKKCHLSNIIIKESELASVISQDKALRLVEDEYFINRRKVPIKSQKVAFRYYDDHTWEINGLPSRNKYDVPDVEDLHYLVSVDGETDTVKKL